MGVGGGGGGGDMIGGGLLDGGGLWGAGGPGEDGEADGVVLAVVEETLVGGGIAVVGWGVAGEVGAAGCIGDGLWVVGAAQRDGVGVGVVELVVGLLRLLWGTVGRDLETAGEVVWICDGGEGLARGAGGGTVCASGRAVGGVRRGRGGAGQGGATHCAFLRWNAIMRSAMSVGCAGSRRLCFGLSMVERRSTSARFRPSAVAAAPIVIIPFIVPCHTVTTYT